VQYIAIHCNTDQCNTLQYRPVQYRAICVMQWTDCLSLSGNNQHSQGCGAAASAMHCIAMHCSVMQLTLPIKLITKLPPGIKDDDFLAAGGLVGRTLPQSRVSGSQETRTASTLSRWICGIWSPSPLLHCSVMAEAPRRASSLLTAIRDFCNKCPEQLKRLTCLTVGYKTVAW
jgi:hypothetical protein